MSGKKPFPPDDFPGERITDDAQGRARWLLDGYVLIYEPDHPMASKKHGTAFEHRMVMHDAGHDLSGRHVHHVNGDRQDNRIANLTVTWPRKHGRQHGRQRWNNISRALAADEIPGDY